MITIHHLHDSRSERIIWLMEELAKLKPEEAAVLALLRARLGKEMAKRKTA